MMKIPSHPLGLVAASAMLISCNHSIRPERAYGPAVAAEAPLHSVEIHQPKTLGVLDTDLSDARGTPIGVSCKTCHGSASRGGLLTSSAPKDFHHPIQIKHGQLSCNACHDQDRSQLHLADGSQVAFDQTVQLCAQCHGTQFRDYRKGAHGGMNGYWDLRRGGRDRNMCVDCHGAHAPAYEKVWPVHPPKDRFLDWKESRVHD